MLRVIMMSLDDKPIHELEYKDKYSYPWSR